MVNNLDHLAAEKAQAVIANTKNQKASDVENTVTKALGVLQEDGVYACFLYLLAKEKGSSEAVIKEMLDLLEQLGNEKNEKTGLRCETALKYITDNVTKDLERLLLAKETLEQMLIYARYGAKARQSEENNKAHQPEDNNNEQEKTP